MSTMKTSQVGAWLVGLMQALGVTIPTPGGLDGLDVGTTVVRGGRRARKRVPRLISASKRNSSRRRKAKAKARYKRMRA